MTTCLIFLSLFCTPEFPRGEYVITTMTYAYPCQCAQP